MPDKRHHRGQHPDDARLFANDRVVELRSAVGDLSLLLSRGYAQPSALKIVGDRYHLEARQRMAVMRAACTDQAVRHRQLRRIDSAALSGKPLLIDGYNVLTTVEAALAGGGDPAGPRRTESGNGSHPRHLWQSHETRARLRMW